MNPCGATVRAGHSAASRVPRSQWSLRHGTGSCSQRAAWGPGKANLLDQDREADWSVFCTENLPSERCPFPQATLVTQRSLSGHSVVSPDHNAACVMAGLLILKGCFWGELP